MGLIKLKIPNKLLKKKSFIKFNQVDDIIKYKMKKDDNDRNPTSIPRS